METTYPICKRCAFTGHRPKSFAWDYEDKSHPKHIDYLRRMEYFIEHAILHNHAEYFLCGSAMGADADFAEAVIRLRQKYPHIRLEIVEPYPSYGESYAEVHKKRYRAIIQQADKVSNTSQKFSPWCIATRNRYLINHSDMLIAAWNGLEEGGTYNTVNYAHKKKKHIHFLSLSLPKDKGTLDRLRFMLQERDCSVLYEEQETNEDTYKLAKKAIEQARLNEK